MYAWPQSRFHLYTWSPGVTAAFIPMNAHDSTHAALSRWALEKESVLGSVVPNAGFFSEAEIGATKETPHGRDGFTAKNSRLIGRRMVFIAPKHGYKWQKPCSCACGHVMYYILNALSLNLGQAQKVSSTETLKRKLPGSMCLLNPKDANIHGLDLDIWLVPLYAILHMISNYPHLSWQLLWTPV